MSGRYLISGVQIGLLRAGGRKVANTTLDTIEEKQFLGDSNKKLDSDVKKTRDAINWFFGHLRTIKSGSKTKPIEKRFERKIGKTSIVCHESSDSLGIIIDKFVGNELTDTMTIWYDDLDG